MKIGGEYTFDGPQDVVWEALLDPQVLASVLPGAEKLDLVGENEYEGALKLKVGPVQGQFMGKVRLEDIRPPDSYTMHVDGRGAPGFVKAVGHLTLAGEGEKTRLEYEGDANVGGRLASVGQRLVETSARAIIKQSLEGLNAAIRARAAAASAPAGDTDAGTPAQPVFETPTQSQFAASVAKEVAKDLIPPGMRTLLLAIGAIVIAVLIWLVVT
jgi:carbon monoxide dehydrogenase subunit G